MPTSHDPLDEFHARAVQYQTHWKSIEFACLATRVESEWVQFAGRAMLTIEPCDPTPKLLPVAELPGLLAYSGRVRVSTLGNLISALRASTVIEGLGLGTVRLAPTGSSPYSWAPLQVWRNSWPQTHRGSWPSALLVRGSGSGFHDRVWQSMPRDIDTLLRRHKPPHNGLASLSAALGLDVDLFQNHPYFELYAELPAQFLASEVDRSKRNLILKLQCVGQPELVIEWLPQRRTERVRVQPGAPGALRETEITVPVPPGATEAEARLLTTDEDADKLTVGVGSQNVLLRICEFFDPEQAKLADLLFNETNLRNANAFELGIARLLALAGYTVLWFGKAAKDSLPDLAAYARTPRAAEYVIYAECTVKNPGEKFSELARRATALKKHLAPHPGNFLAVVLVRNDVTDQEREAVLRCGLALCGGEELRELQQAINSDATPGQVFERLCAVPPHIAAQAL